MRLLGQLFGLILTVMAAAFSAHAEEIIPMPVLIGPTTFSTFFDNVADRLGFDLIYLKHDVNPELRRMGVVQCFSANFYVTSRIELEHFRGRTMAPLPEYSAKTCAEPGLPKPNISDLPTNNEFDLWDKKVISHINRSVYKGIQRFGTLSFQHGHPTEKVYVFLPGLYMNGAQFLNQAEDTFYRGSNVILGTFPGHQNDTLIATENDIGSWLTYTDFLITIARHYGKKVIVVGHSTGGTLAVRAAETGKVDGLVLFEPFFGITKTVSASIAFGKLLPEFLLNFKFQDRNVLEILKIGIEDLNLLRAPFHKLPATLPIDLVVAENDSIVSPEASLRWAEKNAPHARIMKHSWNHMFVINLSDITPTDINGAPIKN